MFALFKHKCLDYYYSLSINKKITFFFIAALSLLLILMALFTYQASSAIVINKTIENTEQSLRLASEKLEIILNNAENYSKIAITSNAVQQQLNKPRTADQLENYTRFVEVSNALADIVDANTLVDSMLVYDRNHYIYDSGSTYNVQNIGDEYFKWLANSAYRLEWKDTGVSNYYKEGSPRNVMSLIQKFNSAKDGSALGIIQLSIDERYISDQYANIDIGDHGQLFIVNKQGIITSHPKKDLLYSTISNEPYFPWVLGHEGGKTFQMEGKDYLVISRDYPRLNWIIIGIVPIQEITKDNQILMRKFMDWSTLFVILAVILAILISKSITRPLLRIKEIVKDVQGGNLEVRLDLKSRDEIGALAKEFNKMVGRTKSLMENMIDEQKKKREYEFAVLQSQINPHFLYNTLESICALADLKRNGDIVNIVNQLALFYRGVLSKGSPIISMEDEMIITQTYLEIMKVRYGDQLHYHFDIEKQAYNYATIKLLLQPLVENSIYHGLKNKRGSGLIEIKGGVRDHKVWFEVRDNGIGLTPEQLKRVFQEDAADYKMKSFGLKSTDERIKLFFGAEYGLEIISAYGEGTTVRISLPVIDKWEDTE